MEIKLVIADQKTGKCAQKTISEADAKTFFNMKIGDSFNGELIGLNGYEFQITGGSDHCGFPMHPSINGLNRFKLLMHRDVGYRAKGDYKREGMRMRKNVAGNMIHDKISQINVKILKYGSENLFPEKEAENAKAE